MKDFYNGPICSFAVLLNPFFSKAFLLKQLFGALTGLATHLAKSTVE